MNQYEMTCSHWIVKTSPPYLYKPQARSRYLESVMPALSSGLSCSFGEATRKTESRTSRMKGFTCSISVSMHCSLQFRCQLAELSVLRTYQDTREWTRIMAVGSRPKGRYGHAVCMSGNTFYVSGGQVDGKFMSDLWGFDLSTRERSGKRYIRLDLLIMIPHVMRPVMVAPTWHMVQPANKAPSPRTGHVLVTYQDKLYMCAFLAFLARNSKPRLTLHKSVSLDSEGLTVHSTITTRGVWI